MRLYMKTWKDIQREKRNERIRGVFVGVVLTLGFLILLGLVGKVAG